VSYVIFVGEPEKGIQRHHWWPYVGWLIFAASFVTIVAVTGYGAIEFYIRQEIAKGTAGIPRNEVGSPARPQAPLIATDQHLMPDQERILLQELPRLRSLITRIQVAQSANDPPAFGVTDQYMRLFTRSGVSPQKIFIDPRGPEDQGILILVADKSKPPKSVENASANIGDSNVHPRVVQWTPNIIPPDGFVFFVAPAPIN